MSSFLQVAVILLLIIVLAGFFNEKVTGLTYEIALMLFAVVIGAVLTVVAAAAKGTGLSELLDQFRLFNIEGFLMDGVLCFMLFAGACHMKLSDFKRLARPVGVLSFVCTLLAALFYGLLFYGAARLLGISLTVPICLMFGSIVAPTDPIAATSILSKFGLPEDTSFLMQGESLFNDGVGVALFVVFSGMVGNDGGGSFFSVMLREILGAVVIGLAVTCVLFIIFKKTGDGHIRIFVSLLSVAAAYWLCEELSCSGAIASVICGIAFAALRSREEEKNKEMELAEFDSFWDIVDGLLNSLLYVMLGVSFVRILQMKHVLLLSLIAVVCGFLARYGGLFVSSFLMGRIPDGIGRNAFCTLFTWGGLRGGLSIALAMSAEVLLADQTYHLLLGCTYAIVFFTTVVQGSSMKKVYRKISPAPR